MFDLFARHEGELMAPLLALLSGRPGVRVIGESRPDPSLRAPTIAFVSDRVSNGDLVAALAEAEVGCGLGHFYAYRLMERLGIDPATGVVRLSLVHYNSAAEVERAVAVLDRLL